MSSCILCGYSSFVFTSGKYPYPVICHWCAAKAEDLDSEALLALQEINDIPPAFTLWSHGRREDSGECAQKFSNPPISQPAEIFRGFAEPGLFVGDLDDVRDIPRLRDLGIGFVLNLCPERLTGLYSDVATRLAEAGIKQLTWPAQDQWDFDIVQNVAKKGACDFIEMGLRSAGVLVNCWGGINRSTTVALAFLVMKRDIVLVDAVKIAMSQRGTVLTNYTFRLLLVQLALETGRSLRTRTDR